MKLMSGSSSCVHPYTWTMNIQGSNLVVGKDIELCKLQTKKPDLRVENHTLKIRWLRTRDNGCQSRTKISICSSIITSSKSYMYVYQHQKLLLRKPSHLITIESRRSPIVVSCSSRGS